MDKGNEYISTEITEMLDYIVEKFNITLNLTSEQIINFSKQLVSKILTWEIVISLLCITIAISIIVLTLVINSKVKKEKINLDIFKNIKVVNENDNKEKSIYEIKSYIKSITKYMSILIIFICSIEIAVKLYRLILCITFPEKIILEFISQYI